MTSFSNRIVAVTGATGNLGHACASLFHDRGATLVLIDRSTGKLAQAFPDLDARRHLLADGIDPGDTASVDALFDSVGQRYGRLDALVHTVGAFAGGKPVDQESPDTFGFMMKVNAETALTTIAAALPLMRRTGGGHIVTVASRNALAGAANYAAYGAAKAALLRITESVAGENKTAGITANCVLPGTIDTPQNRAAMPEADYSKWVTVAEIAAVIAFLASDEARAVTAAAIPVYGRG